MTTQPEPAFERAVGSLRELDRRTFISMVLGLIAAAPTAHAAVAPAALAPARLSDGGGSLSVASVPSSLNLGALLGTLSDPSAAAWLGQRYLADHPHEQDANRLIDRLSAALSEHQGRLPADRAALSQALSALIKDEYISAPLQSVEGWMLAPSEARLYALAALAASPRKAERPNDLPTSRTPHPHTRALEPPRTTAGC
ncbi:MAG: hypothetical protein VBE63_18870 [Lamprobacter sp.]|uniref:hypothetical protein n=1 Tax=Lamprobacter sp. TaxID=3100796 RepID=UPI002B25BDAC|nr:hypothetical protein [Lamprobacter sp.]MEA3641980.1 hypothetical protein [Lamprobacter sp.]